MNKFTLQQLISVVLEALRSTEESLVVATDTAKSPSSPTLDDLSVYSGSNIIYDPDMVLDESLKQKSLVEAGLVTSQMLLFDFFDDDRLPLQVLLSDADTKIDFNLIPIDQRLKVLELRRQLRQDGSGILEPEETLEIERPSKMARLELETQLSDDDVEVIL